VVSGITPVVAIVGNSDSGKTTLIEKLIPELTSRGYRVATIKHAPEHVQSAGAQKDSQRHLRAGSAATVISSPDQVTLIKPVTGDPGPEELAGLLGDEYDIILAEGFKHSAAPKVLVHRQAAGQPPADIRGVIATATDEPADGEPGQLSLEDVAALADLIERDLMGGRQRLALYVNGRPIPLTPFVMDFMGRTLTGMVSALRGVGEVRSLRLLFRKGER
jgi:molybdopterin-guanine dinucleotide biosynthesis protein MobB